MFKYNMPLKLIFAIETSNFGAQVQPRWSALFSENFVLQYICLEHER